ncbi:hypothetical protein [Mycobacterium asiaticum]|nr:hypothetical protein [Mycobacterium asiaticum]
MPLLYIDIVQGRTPVEVRVLLVASTKVVYESGREVRTGVS